MTMAKRRGIVPLLVFFGSLALYAGTAIRTPGWLDDTLILELAHSAEVGSWVNTHNLFNILGHFWMGALWFLDPHAALTLFCGLLASVSVLFAYHAGRELTGNPAAGGLAAVALAVSHSLWWHATVVEVYSLNAAFISLDLFLVARFFRAKSFPSLCAAFFLFGIGVFNHVLMGLFAGAYGALFVILLAGRERIGWRRGLLLVAATAAGCIPYVVVFARDVAMEMHRGGVAAAIVSTLDGATGSFFRQSMFPRNLTGTEQLFWKLNYLFLLWYNFPAAALPLAAWGTVRLRLPETPRPFAVFFWLALAAQVIWSSNYLIWDMYAFSMPVYVLASLPLAVGIDALLRRARPALKAAAVGSLLLPAALYPLVTAIPALAELGRKYVALYSPAPRGLEREYAAVRSQATGRRAATGGVWDPVRYLMDPARSGYREVDDFCRPILERLPANAHFWDDDSKGGYPLHYYYLGILGERPDVSLHLVLAMHVDESLAVQEAMSMRAVLAEKGEVFVSSLEWPERELVIQLSRLSDARTDPPVLRRMTAGQFMEKIPGVAITAVPLGTRPGLSIYRVGSR
jgi:hypothetical protein